MTSDTYHSEFSSWIEQEKLATELVNVAGRLSLDHSIELVLFRKLLFNVNNSKILAHHQYARQVSNLPITVEQTLELAQAIQRLELAPSRIDMERLASEWLKEAKNYGSSATDFVK